MPQCNYVIKDNTTGLFLTFYSTVLANCGWGNVQDAICFDDASVALTNDMNTQAGEEDRFIGQNPPPR